MHGSSMVYPVWVGGGGEGRDRPAPPKASVLAGLCCSEQGSRLSVSSPLFSARQKTTHVLFQ
jgi:hypothetical protein